jgi:hypothetical protein
MFLINCCSRCSVPAIFHYNILFILYECDVIRVIVSVPKLNIKINFN